MALVPNGKIAFKTGSLSTYESLGASVNNNALYAVHDASDNFYLYLGANPIKVTDVETTAVIARNETKPPSSDAVYNYFENNKFIKLGNLPVDSDLVNISEGTFHYYTDGHLAFRYSMNEVPVLLQQKFSTGEGLSFEKNSISNELVLKLADADKYILAASNTAQTISSDLNVENITLTSGKTLKTDTIQKSSTAPNQSLTLSGNTSIEGSLSVSTNTTIGGTLRVSGVSTLAETTAGALTASSTTISTTLTNTNIFKTQQASDSTGAAQVVLDSGTELYFGSGKSYYLKPSAANLPRTTMSSASITDSLTANSISATSATFTTVEGSYITALGSITIGNSVDGSTAKVVINNNSIKCSSGSTGVEDLTINNNLIIKNNSIALNKDTSVTGTVSATTGAFNSLTLNSATIAIKTEGEGSDQSGIAVADTTHRLFVGSNYVLTNKDVADTANGIIGKEFASINSTISSLQSADTNLNTAIQNYLYVGDVAPTGNPNVKLWIDTSETSGTPNGVIRYYRTGATPEESGWIAVNAVWG